MSDKKVGNCSAACTNKGNATAGQESAARTQKGDATAGNFSAARTFYGDATAEDFSAACTSEGNTSTKNYSAARTYKGNATAEDFSAACTYKGDASVGDYSVAWSAQSVTLGRESVGVIYDRDDREITTIIINSKRKQEDFKIVIEDVDELTYPKNETKEDMVDIIATDFWIEWNLKMFDQEQKGERDARKHLH